MKRWRCTGCGALVISANPELVEQLFSNHSRTCGGELVAVPDPNAAPTPLGELIDLDRIRRYARKN